ncbi:MAG: Hsp20 family protein [Acidobacteria bacterium]|nr:Hsp20 family protein [Acidobacteriota bacterium]
MKPQQVLEPKTTEKPIFVEAEKLLARLEEVTKAVAHRAYEFFEERGRQFGNELEDWFRAEAELLRYVPATMKEDENQYTIRAEVPGFKANEIKISVEPKRLILEGNSEQSAEEKSEKVVFSERRTHQFCRSFRLPVEVETDKVTANLKDGLLEITLPKMPVRQPVGIEINSV